LSRRIDPASYSLPVIGIHFNNGLVDKHPQSQQFPRLKIQRSTFNDRTPHGPTSPRVEYEFF
jgi:hypothetical protein